MKQKKDAFEDDGRTIAPMDFVSHTAPFGHIPKRHVKKTDENAPTAEAEPLTKKERRALVNGALKAALLIGGAFIVGLGLFILLLDLLLYYR